MEEKSIPFRKFWTEYVGVSPALGYRALKEGWAPVTFMCGRRRFVSAPASKEWIQKREKENSKNQVTT